MEHVIVGMVLGVVALWTAAIIWGLTRTDDDEPGPPPWVNDGARPCRPRVRRHDYRERCTA